MNRQHTLDLDVLLKAIKDFADDYGRGAHAYIMKRTGVHNTKRMVDGNHSPSLDTWTKLHASMPDDFPPPTMQGEEIRINTQKARDGATQHMSFGGENSVDKLPPLDKELLQLLSDYPLEGQTCAVYQERLEGSPAPRRDYQKTQAIFPAPQGHH